MVILFRQCGIFFNFYLITYTMHKGLYCLSNFYLFSTILFDQLVTVCTVLSNRFVTFWTILSILFLPFCTALSYRFVIFGQFCWENITWHFPYRPLVSARNSHMKLDSDAEGLIWVGGGYQGRYGKCHVIIYLSHILYWLFPSKHWHLYCIQDLWTDKLRK